MSTIYWDTMMFIYLLEDSPEHGERVASIYESMQKRGDVLCSCTFTLAELLVGPRKQGDFDLEQRIIAFFESGEVRVIPFDIAAAKQFASIRASRRVSPADAIHLACASVGGIDLYLTNDDAVRQQIISGINFIDGLQTTVL